MQAHSFLYYLTYGGGVGWESPYRLFQFAPQSSLQHSTKQLLIKQSVIDWTSTIVNRLIFVFVL